MKKFYFLLFLSSFLFAQEPTPYAAQPARHSEEWVKDGIIYEVYPRAFSKEGNFAGVEKKLPEIKKLGATIVWLMPIHPVGIEKRKGMLGSPYSIQDYYGINPEFGTLDDFKKLVAAAHENELKIIIDLVANHTSWDSKMMKEHPEWFTKDSAGNFIPPVPDWSDVVDLNYNNTNMRHYVIEMMKYWVRDVGIDGFRCDVSEQVPTDFWNDARAALDSIKPVIMLSEGQYPEHHLKAFDLTYSWNYYHTVSQIFKGEWRADELDSILAREALAYPKGSLRLRFSSNHDENAWDNPDLIKFGKDGAKLAAVLANTFPGVPLIYNGQEAGNKSKLGLFEKFEIDWTKGKEWRDFYTKLFSIRKNSPALAEGDFQTVKNNRPDIAYSFIRTTGKNTMLTAFNFTRGKKSVQLYLPKAFASLKFTDAFSGKKIDYKNVQRLHLSAHGFKVFVVE